ncbi:MAG TPA: hypothetical protein H9830_07720 [Candidatus Agrococcus pullicola]|uniref:Uncharacterized protein n=1 Tax=Candidatus Agrococcus pullicola TaxID=2838429 RepID=A0A9D1YUN3_9MICO|nr:hypothetical protein [Candidatus Agrococcus pullicola]
MTDPVSDQDSTRQPTDQELRNVRIPSERARVINIMTLAFLVADAIILGLAVWFFADGNEFIAYLLLGYVLLSIAFVFWFRKMQTRRAKLLTWEQDPLNRTL